MKNFLIAAVAALMTVGASAAMAGGLSHNVDSVVEPYYYPVQPDRGIELSFTTFGESTDELGDNWELRGAVDVLTYHLGAGESTLTLYSEFGAIAADEFAAVGAEYEWAVYIGGAAELELEADVAYVMTNNFDDGAWLVTPNANLAVDMTDAVAVFGEVGYTWDASNDWTDQGGYAELGFEFGVTETLTLVPSVVRTFDSTNDRTVGSLEARFNF